MRLITGKYGMCQCQGLVYIYSIQLSVAVMYTM